MQTVAENRTRPLPLSLKKVLSPWLLGDSFTPHKIETLHQEKQGKIQSQGRRVKRSRQMIRLKCKEKLCVCVSVCVCVCAWSVTVCEGGREGGIQWCWRGSNSSRRHCRSPTYLRLLKGLDLVRRVSHRGQCRLVRRKLTMHDLQTAMQKIDRSGN